MPLEGPVDSLLKVLHDSCVFLIIRRRSLLILPSVRILSKEGITGLHASESHGAIYNFGI